MVIAILHPNGSTARVILPPETGSDSSLTTDEEMLIAQHNEIVRMREIEDAAMNLCKVRGRHNSEIAMRRLMVACGFGNVLPPNATVQAAGGVMRRIA